jgi:Protein of unknown function DUF262
VERIPSTMTIVDLRSLFVDLEFPEYQREPDVWSRDQKQRLIDSILRQFDIASIYIYAREDGGFECIDGRQRINAILSFLGDNIDDADNGFALKIQNEISSALPSTYAVFEGQTFDRLQTMDDPLAHEAVRVVLDYKLTVVNLSGAMAPDEFNLQFLRLNLGTLINAGEKLHAMVGRMRDIAFEPSGIGLHPFFEQVGIPTRRFAKEQTAAQVLLQVFSQAETGEFARARHFDLQRFFKSHADVAQNDRLVGSVAATLDVLQAELVDAGRLLRNRAMTVTVVLLAWQQELYDHSKLAKEFPKFLDAFVARLRWQVKNMKDFTVDERYDYLVDFQRHLTQASVEKPAVTQRHERLQREWQIWRQVGALTGDAEYMADTGEDPPVLLA